MYNKRVKYKALICDVDGTLIINHKDALPSEKTRHAIAQAAKKVSVSIATGRPPQYVENLLVHLAVTGPCILANGAIIYDPVHKQTVREHCLSPDDVTSMIPLLTKMSTQAFVRDANGRHELTEKFQPVEPTYVYFPPLTPEALNLLENHVRKTHDLIIQKMIAWSEGETDYMVTKNTATKQHAILEVAQILGITTHEIIGVGDGYNDFPLLMACGFKVAMGNAVPDLKAVADYIAPTVGNDGVVDVIEKFIL